MHVACEFLVRECTRGVATTRHICPTSYTARNNEPVIGILGRVCISIQDVVASPIDVTTFQSNSPFASFHDLHFPSALAFPPRQFLPTRRVLCTHVIYKKEKLASSITKERKGWGSLLNRSIEEINISVFCVYFYRSRKKNRIRNEGDRPNYSYGTEWIYSELSCWMHKRPFPLSPSFEYTTDPATDSPRVGK